MNILVLLPECPIPIKNGFQDRAFNLFVKELSKYNEIYVAFMSKSNLKEKEKKYLKKYCKEIIFAKPTQKTNFIDYILPVPRYVKDFHSDEMQQRLDLISDSIDLCIVKHSGMVQYVNKGNFKKILDIDYDERSFLLKQFKYLGIKDKFLSFIRFIKGDYYLKKHYSLFDSFLVVSEKERSKLKLENVLSIPNGVNLSDFAFKKNKSEKNQIIHPGSLTFVANKDAADFFQEMISPFIRKKNPTVKLVITGKYDKNANKSLISDKNIVLTGFVKNINKLIQESKICVVPLRIGGGTRTKILKSMALGTPVVSTSVGVEGLDVVDGEHCLIRDDPKGFADAIIKFLNEHSLRQKLSRNARKLIETKYDWKKIGTKLNKELTKICK